MTLYDHEVTALDGNSADLRDDERDLTLVVNVAKCGLTPQYAASRASSNYDGRGFTVLGFPCNQFGGQEPGTAADIETFCSTTYGVTFPMFAKVEVNGPDRDPVYGELTAAADADGEAGDVQWNFENFLVAPGGAGLGRFRPGVEPDSPQLVAAIESNLPR